MPFSYGDSVSHDAKHNSQAIEKNISSLQSSITINEKTVNSNQGGCIPRLTSAQKKPGSVVKVSLFIRALGMQHFVVTLQKYFKVNGY